MSKKNVLDMSEEELIDLASKVTPKIQKNSDKLADPHRYIISKNIKPGNTKIPTDIIYHDYVKWKKDLGGYVYNRLEFFKVFKQMFEAKKSNGNRFYLLDETSYELTKEVYEEARAFKKQDTSYKKKPS